MKNIKRILAISVMAVMLCSVAFLTSCSVLDGGVKNKMKQVVDAKSFTFDMIYAGSDDVMTGKFDFENRIFYSCVQNSGTKYETYVWYNKNTDEYYIADVYNRQDETEVIKQKISKGEFVEEYLNEIFENCINNLETYLTTISLWDYDNAVYTLGSSSETSNTVEITIENGNLIVKTIDYYSEKSSVTYSDVNKTKITIPERVLSAELK